MFAMGLPAVFQPVSPPMVSALNTNSIPSLQQRRVPALYAAFSRVIVMLRFAGLTPTSLGTVTLLAAILYAPCLLGKGR
ncbi:hypothetical protein DXD24_02585 [Collinsella sp. TF12-2AT]|nr:hypothetical protein DXD24_02585 [Collinsella sp. TF12-2AT]